MDTQVQSLAKVVNGTIHEIRIPTHEELQLLESANAVIGEFNHNFKLMEYMLHNAKEISLFLDDTLNRVAHVAGSINGFFYDETAKKINITLLNFLTSARTFLDHFETFVKRKYGKSSEESELFKSIVSHEFDNEFAYSFMYKLRNYVQHCGMPPIDFEIKTITDEENPSIEYVLNFNKNILLRDYDSWGAIVKPRIEAQEDLFPVIPIVESLLVSYKKIYSVFIKTTYFEEIKIAKDQILEFINEPPSYCKDEYCLFEKNLTDPDTGKFTFNCTWIPCSLLQKVQWLEQMIEEI